MAGMSLIASRSSAARRVLAGLGASALLLTTAACGGSDDGPEATGPDMDMAEMNDPGATPADEVDGDVRPGTFEVLPTAPPGSDDVAGDAWLAQNDAGTTVTVRLTGLEPGTTYMGHLHAEPCSTDAGGPHFAFDPDGEEVPPNEVHLGFTATDEGTGEATVTNDTQVGDAAPSVVVHPADAMDNRVACADFAG